MFVKLENIHKGKRKEMWITFIKNKKERLFVDKTPLFR